MWRGGVGSNPVLCIKTKPPDKAERLRGRDEACPTRVYEAGELVEPLRQAQ